MFSHYIFWPWFTGLVFLIMGLISVRGEFLAAAGLEKIMALGRVFVASALACFGAEHMVNIGPFSPMVPRWIPFHAFWVVFVGLALLAAGLSLAWNRYTRLSSMMLGVMFVIFVLTMDIPGAASNPRDRFSWTLLLRETFFAAGPLAFAGAQPPRSRILVLAARLVSAVAFVFYSIMHVLHPQNVPGVPLERLSPPWLFWPHVWATVTALLLLTAGALILVDRYARAAAAWLGFWMLLLTIIVYVPMLIPANDGRQLIEAVNYIWDTLLFCGSILMLASAMPQSTSVRVREAEAVKAARV